VLRSQLPLIESLPQVGGATADGQAALPRRELVVIISLPRLVRPPGPRNVPVRGCGVRRAFQVRDTIEVAEGRRFHAGGRGKKIDVGRLASRRFGGLTLGRRPSRFGGRFLERSLGFFTAGDASFESEVLGATRPTLMMPAFQAERDINRFTVKLTESFGLRVVRIGDCRRSTAGPCGPDGEQE